MLSVFALTTLAATATYAADNVNRANFDPFADNAARKADIARLQTLTTGTPFTTECAGKQGAERTTCETDLAKELVDLQINVQRDFFKAFIDQFLIFGQPFDRNKINDFDINRECQTKIDTFKNFLNAQQIADLKKECNNVKVAADKLRTAVRDQLDVEQATANNQAKVDEGLINLDQTHLAFFDKVFNAQQQNQFIDLTEDADRALQSFDGFLLAQLSATVAEFKKANYRNYKGEVVAKADLESEVQKLIALALKELANNKLIVDAGKRLNALTAKPTPDALVAAGALKLAAARKETIDAPVALHWRVDGVDATKEQETLATFKASMGPETFALKGVKQTDGTLTIDMATGMDQNEITTRDSELGLTCVEKQFKCTVVEDVHQPSFDLAQVKDVVKKVVDDDDGYAAPATHPVAHDTNSASSLFMAAGAVLASLVLFL